MWNLDNLKGGPGASGRVLPPVTGRSRVRVAVSSHCTGEGKARHWHPSPDPAQSGSSLHWVRPLVYVIDLNTALLFYIYVVHCCLQQEESPLAKVTRDSSKITAEQVHGLMSQVIIPFFFNFVWLKIRLTPFGSSNVALILVSYDAFRS